MKAIICDLDGSLMPPSSGLYVSEKVKEKLIEIQKHGIMVILNSARIIQGVYPLAKQIQMDDFGGYVISCNGCHVMNVKTNETVFEYQISKKDAGKAVIELDFKNPDIGIKRIPVDIVEKNGVYAVVLNPKTALRAEAFKMTNLPDLPQSSGQKHLNWSGTVETDTPYPVFTVRAIGRSGRIFRSHAVMPVQIPGAPFQEVACFSETVKKAVKVKIPEALLPDIHYLFGPDSGAMLRSDSGRYFDGRLGGGFHYMEAFSHPLTKVAAGDRAPQWVRDGKEWLLRFDGVNDYINNPIPLLYQSGYPDYQSRQNFG